MTTLTELASGAASLVTIGCHHPSWINLRLPFSQIHGHTTNIDWLQGTNRRHDLGEFTTVDPLAKHETARLSGGRLIGIDPGHSSAPVSPWRALELQCGSTISPADPQDIAIRPV